MYIREREELNHMSCMPIVSASPKMHTKPKMKIMMKNAFAIAVIAFMLLRVLRVIFEIIWYRIVCLGCKYLLA